MPGNNRADLFAMLQPEFFDSAQDVTQHELRNPLLIDSDRSTFGAQLHALLQACTSLHILLSGFAKQRTCINIACAKQSTCTNIAFMYVPNLFDFCCSRLLVACMADVLAAYNAACRHGLR